MQAKVFKNTSVYIFIGFLPVAANFLLAPIYTQYLKPEAYALIGVATLFQTFLTFFLSLSLDGAFGRLFFDFEKKGKLKHALLSTILLSIVFITGVVFLLLGLTGDYLFSLLFKNDSFRFSNLGVWVQGTTVANVLFLFFAILYRNEGRITAFVIVNLLFFFIPVAGTLAGLIFFGGAPAAIIGRAIGSITVVVVLLLFYFVRHKPLFKLDYLKKCLRYSLPLVPYQLMFAAFSNIDRIFLERSFLPHAFGVYTFAIMVTGVIPIYLNALTNATSPTIYRELTNGKNFGLVKNYNTAIVLSTLGIICLSMAGIVPAMRVFINAEYADSYPYIAALFLSFLPYVHYLVYCTPLFYHGNTKAFPVISFFALVAGILFNYFFIPILGIWAVCLSLYIIRIVQMLGAYVFVKRYQYQGLRYIEQKKELLLSLGIFVIYNVMLLVNTKLKIVSEDFINLIPLGVFILACATFYNKEVKELQIALFKKKK